jgi:pimeloyl-ACP methyl ester carboxylesterase
VTTFVLVHGAWHGAWSWQPVRDLLAAEGHETVAPDLAGLGERTHVLTRSVGLATHVADVIGALEGADLRDVVLVGHSYGAMVATVAAALQSDRVRQTVLVDGFLPFRGECAIDLLPPHTAEVYRTSALERGDGWQVPPRPLANLGVTDLELAEAVAPRLTPHPLKTYLDAAQAGATAEAAKGVYLLCSGWSTVFGPMAERARGLGWTTNELDADHEVPLTDPARLAAALVNAVSATDSTSVAEIA